MKKRANGEGSTFYNERRGRWEAIGPAPLRLTRTGKTQAEAIRRRDLALAKSGNIAHLSAKQTLASYLASWLSTKAADVSARTHDGYQDIITKHIVPNIGDVKLCDVKPQHIQRVLDMAKSKWTKRAAYRLLKAALALAAKWDVIPKNPADKVDAPATVGKPVTPLEDAHFYAFLEAVKDDRLVALWRLLLAVGARRGEAVALARSAVDLEAGTVTFTRSLQRVRKQLTFLPTKTKRSNRTVTLPASEIPVLKAHLSRQKEEKFKAGELWEENDLVFCTRLGKPLEPRNVTRRLYQLVAAYNDAKDRKEEEKIPRSKLHALRHTAVSVLLREGVDVQAVSAMVGHARTSFTYDVYGHLMTKPNVTAEKMNDVLGRKAK